MSENAPVNEQNSNVDNVGSRSPETSVAAVILAGGLARRMGGVDKGLVQLKGEPMVSRALRRVKPQVARIVINANRNHEAYGKFSVPVVADSIDGHLGPLAGLLTALEYFDEEYVFMCPCDSPFLPENMVSRMFNAMQTPEPATLAVATDGVRTQPVFLLVHKSCQSTLTGFLEAGERKIDRWFDKEKLVEVSFEDFPDAFRNINTEDELKAVEVELDR